MITYEQYRIRFGDKKNDYHVSISEDIYNILSAKSRLGIAFENEINLALMEDVLIRISSAMMNNDKNNMLKTWKKVGDLIKKVLLEYKDDENKLNNRYYEISLSPEERDVFVSNPVVINNMILGEKEARGVIAYSMFYRAMCTLVGEHVRIAIAKEQKKAVEELYDAKMKNGTTSYYNALKEIVSNWSRRIGAYESYSSELKTVNRRVTNVGK